MAKLQIKNDTITSFGGIYLIDNIFHRDFACGSWYVCSVVFWLKEPLLRSIRGKQFPLLLKYSAVFCVLRGNKKSRFCWEIRILLLFAFLLCGATEKNVFFYLQVVEYHYFLKAAQL